MAGRISEERKLLSKYLAEIRRIPLLSREEEERLALEVREGRAGALDKLVESNLSFVVRVAHEYRSLGVPLEDLLNEGNLGLIEAARRFDPGKGTKFVTYAIWWIRKSIITAIADKSRLVRVPYDRVKKAREIGEAEERLKKILGRRPCREEIAEHLCTTAQRVSKTLAERIYETSLDEKSGEEEQGRPLADLLRDIGISPEQRLLQRESLRGLDKAFDCLNEQQKRVMTLRFGLGGDTPMSLQQAGTSMGISRERVRQVELRAKERLRAQLAGEPVVRRRRRRITPDSPGRRPGPPER